MDTSTLLKLREELITGKKDPKEIGEALYEKDQKSWHEKEWKAKRKLLLKEECEQCEGKDGLLIQHLWHPVNYRTALGAAKNKYREKWRSENPVDCIIKEQYVIDHLNKIEKKVKDVCPDCLSVNMKERKTIKPKYKCGFCSSEFENKLVKEIPILHNDLNNTKPTLRKNSSVFLYSEIQELLYVKLSNEMYWEEYEKQIYYEVYLRLIDESIRYISFKDTKTFCKKCAFLWDKRNKDLCPFCKENYKFRHLKRCHTC